MIKGMHALIYSRNANEVRSFFKEVLRLRSVDAGDGWLIFALPPAELAVHPARKSGHELYLMCQDIDSSVRKLKAKGVKVVEPVTDRGWGLVTRIKLKGGDEFGLYQPKHRTAIRWRGR